MSCAVSQGYSQTVVWAIYLPIFPSEQQMGSVGGGCGKIIH